MGHLSGEYLFEIFARQKREDRLEHIGTVSAPNPALAPVMRMCLVMARRGCYPAEGPASRADHGAVAGDIAALLQ